MTQATNTTPSDLIVQHKGVWKVYTKSSFIDEWVVNEQLFVVNVSQTLGRNTGTATLKYLAQDETLQNNLKIAGWEHHNLSMTGTTMPQTTLVKIQNESQPPAEGALIAEPEIIFIGIILGKEALGGFLVGSLITGVPLAIFLANVGGAWDNAKKYVEEGNLGGKGSEVHKSTVICDTVGDPCKDTSGPSLNILLKLMAVVSLVFGLFLEHIHQIIVSVLPFLK